MAALGEIPFGRYYGSVDATPLFVMLAGRYFDRTGDLETIRAHLAAHRSRARLDRSSTATATATASSSTSRATETGLANQGWKDSHDAIFHADGVAGAGADRALRGAGLRLCGEASRGGARRSARRTAPGAGAPRRRPRICTQAFERAFWCEDLGVYALALDGDKRPCRVVSSNAAQCLISGIAVPERARRIAEVARAAGHVLRWGLRTIRDGEARYNPMAYHNGSIWPHDTRWPRSACALRPQGRGGVPGRRSLGGGAALRAAAPAGAVLRLPRMGGEAPTRYPTACAPQAGRRPRRSCSFRRCSGSTWTAAVASSRCASRGCRRSRWLRLTRIVGRPGGAGFALRAARRRRRHQRDPKDRRRQWVTDCSSRSLFCNCRGHGLWTRTRPHPSPSHEVALRAAASAPA